MSDKKPNTTCSEDTVTGIRLTDEARDYGAKILFENSVGNEIVYEECVVKFRANSLYDAQRRAEGYASDVAFGRDEAINRAGAPIFVREIYVDCFPVRQSFDDVEVVYDSFQKNETSLPEEALQKQLTSSCPEDYLKKLFD